jgi:valyl-tRNA synthetase
VEQGRNFCNKIWNAYRLIAGWQTISDDKVSKEILASNQLANEWFEMKYQLAVNDILNLFKDYKLSEALMTVYKLIWDDFCSWYLEMIKPVYGEPINESTLAQAKLNLEKVLTLLHPFMPFITEELYHVLYNGQPEKPLIVSAYPKAAVIEKSIDDNALAVISEIRNIRNSKGLSPKIAFELIVKTSHEENYKKWESILLKLANVSSITYNGSKPEKCLMTLIGTDEIYIPFAESIDEVEEQKKMQEEIQYLEGFLKSVDAKLNNERFVTNAKPDVIEKERQKRADAMEKIEKLKKRLGQNQP